MHFYNCNQDEFIENIHDKQIVVFGAGGALQYSCINFFRSDAVISRIKYIVDNGSNNSTVTLLGKEFPLYNPNCLLAEKDIIVLIVNINYSFQIYNQLEKMNLDDSIHVYNLRFIMAITCGHYDVNIADQMCIKNRKEVIPKSLHSFWFSGDDMPDDYKRCIESWYINCPGYEIKIWNQDTYESNGSVFFESAISQGKWAFAADYARLDILNRLGGIYLDSDVEVVRSMDCLLGNKAFFSFDMNYDVGLEVFGTVPGNEFINDCMYLYDNKEYDITDKMVVQPKLIRSVVEKWNINLNGNMQFVDGMFFASRNFFNPQDYATFDILMDDNYTFTIHRANSGWLVNSEKTRVRGENRILYSKLEDKQNDK